MLSKVFHSQTISVQRERKYIQSISNTTTTVQVRKIELYKSLLSVQKISLLVPITGKQKNHEEKNHEEKKQKEKLNVILSKQSRWKHNQFLIPGRELNELIQYHIKQGSVFLTFAEDSENKIHPLISAEIGPNFFKGQTSTGHPIDYKTILGTKCRLWIGRHNILKDTVDPLPRSLLPYHSTEFTRDHALSQVRSDYFAKLCKQVFDQDQLDLKNPYFEFDAYHLMVDGGCRNPQALIDVGIPLRCIILIEMNRRTALYQKFLAGRPERDIHVIYTGSELRTTKGGLVNYILQNQFKNTYLEDNTCELIKTCYLDFCGWITKDCHKIIPLLPNLQVLAITQGKRNLDKTRLDKIIQVLPKGFELVKVFDQPKVTCHFFVKNPIAFKHL